MVIYLVTNEISGKSYIGKTKRAVEVRWAEHLDASRKGSTTVFHCAIRKYGEQAFSVRELATAETNSAASQLERLWIIALQTRDRRYGYNMTSGGDGVDTGVLSSGMRGRHHSEETKRKIALANKGRTLSEEQRRKVSLVQIGKVRWPNGRTFSEEHCKALSKGHLGSVVSPRTREKLHDALVGRRKVAVGKREERKCDNS